MSKEQRQSSKLCGPRSLDVHKNTVALMIVILGHLELDTEASDTGIKPTESDDCRGMSINDRDANGVLATM